MERENLENALVNREFVYRYTWRFFAAEPDAESLALAAGDVARVQVAALLGEGSEGARAQERIAEMAEGADVDVLSSEFTALFVGPGRPVVPLWESVHRDPDGILFTETTLAVRQAYADAGFEARAYPKEADDYLAIELDFMAALVHRTLEAVMQGKDEWARAYLTAQERFLDEHLNQWVGSAYERMAEDAPERIGNFYAYALALAREVCKTDLSAIKSCLEAFGE